MPNTKETLVELSEQLRYCAVDDDCINCKRWDFDCGSRHCLDDLMLKASELLKSIANGITVQEWISVKDRLPEDDLPKDTDRKQIRCLVATDKGTVKPCVRQRYQTKKNGQWCLSPWEWNKDLFAKPTHWMPLPEPPRGE